MITKYKRSPIQEAIFEARFSYDCYDSTVPGQVFEKVKINYPKKKDIQQITLILGNSYTSEQSANRPTQAPVLQAWKKNDSELIQIGPGIAVANHLNYINWENFIPAIREILDAYLTTATPKFLQRIGVRYINKFIIREENINFPEYFNLGIQLPETLRAMQGFDLTFIHKPNDTSSEHVFEVRTKFMTTPLKPNEVGNGFILDLDCYLASTIELNLEQMIFVATQAHNIIGEVFESLLTDKTRHLMEIEQ